jgi:YcaO-like protein with predicted kinase domain
VSVEARSVARRWRRSVPPEETVERARGLFGVFGITRLADVTGLDRIGIPVAVAVRPNARSLSTSQGKGTTWAAACASAVMESIETWHAERVRVPLRLASWDELRWSTSVSDPALLPQTRTSLWQPGTRLLWALSRRQRDDEPVWVPYELVHTDYTLPRPTGAGCFLASSNGLASGNTPDEALSHALCEVVERDSTTLWHRLSPEQQRASRLDLGSVEDPECAALVKQVLAADVGIAVWDTTSDVGIPAFECVVAERGEAGHTMHSASGMGCHPNRAIAFSRAVTEAAQSRVTIITGARDDVVRADYDRIRDPSLLRRDHALVFDDVGERSFTDAPDLPSSTVEQDISAVLAGLTSIGCDDVLVLDLSHDEIGIPVVRVVVPGLESANLLSGYRPGPRAMARP